MTTLKLYTLPFSQSLLSHLTDYLLSQNNHDPLALSAIHVILPTRRSVRRLKQLLLDKAPQSTLLLPKIEAVSDLTPPLEINILPEIPFFYRLGLLFKLITEEKEHLKTYPSVKLAQTLCTFIDSLQKEEAELADLASVITDNLAHHWQLSLSFLELFQKKWPSILKDLNYQEPWPYRRNVWEAITTKWLSSPPSHPIITAGLSGDIPAIGRLLKCVATLPQGQVILPGFDMSLTLEERESLESTHPQFTHKRFFDREQIGFKSVKIWGETKDPFSPRDRALSVLMKRDLSQVQINLSGLTILEEETPQDEVECVALLVREKLTIPDQSITIVTPDRQFGKRLQMELRRWNIDIDDSAGVPLIETALGQFLLLTAKLKEFEEDPTHNLAVLKHPYTQFIAPRARLLKLVRSLETQVLRAEKDLSDFSNSLLERVEKHCKDPQKNEIMLLLTTWDQITQPFLNIQRTTTLPFKTLFEAHLTLVELLSSQDILWNSEAGQVLLPHLQELRGHADTFPPMNRNDYAFFLTAFLTTLTIREPFSHPRVQLLGPIEAHLIQADVVVLANVNEGVWPGYPAINPWFNNQMQLAIGLPEREAQIGREALDFTLALGNKEVILTRALRTEGKPTTPSRWLLRLKTLGSSCQQNLSYPHPIRIWHHLLDEPTHQISLPEPLPCPPVSARPLKLSISDIELLLKDAYAFYIKYILKLSPLGSIEMTLTPALFGIWLHRILEKHPTADTLSQFTLEKETDPIWIYQFKKIREWLLTQDEFKTPSLTLLTEKKLKEQWKHIEIVGKADRLQINDQGIEVIDYKTGNVPTSKELKEGGACQLPLLAFLAQSSLKQPILKLAYWDLKKQMIRPIEDFPSIISFYQQILEKLINDYLKEETIFKSPLTGKDEKTRSFQHFKRAQEWLSNRI